MSCGVNYPADSVKFRLCREHVLTTRNFEKHFKKMLLSRLTDVVIGTNREYFTSDSLTDFYDKYASIDRALFSILDPREGLNSGSKDSKASKPKVKSSDEDKEKYLSIFSSGGGFKSLSDIVVAVNSLNTVIKQED